jgi:hypothetical protein
MTVNSGMTFQENVTETPVVELVNSMTLDAVGNQTESVPEGPRPTAYQG